MSEPRLTEKGRAWLEQILPEPLQRRLIIWGRVTCNGPPEIDLSSEDVRAIRRYMDPTTESRLSLWCHAKGSGYLNDMWTMYQYVGLGETKAFATHAGLTLDEAEALLAVYAKDARSDPPRLSYLP